ncbi:hypothetical protein CBR_g4584 [Chara braunii]|uniref:NIF system FeS cluster assembly NifU C-terminal domain-containing protein n=1 Tax=Chara braunii TaxID=69332 RepID=A0A388KIG2_CHABU|nr:hypothetical protein CBR_g4584 [Chara braunii]|eukprot:GBG69753.1 hypothetical protein CBR_g4584 [Chara braunii]
MEACMGSAFLQAQSQAAGVMVASSSTLVGVAGLMATAQERLQCQTLPGRTVLSSMARSPTLAPSRRVQVGLFGSPQKGSLRSAVTVIRCSKPEAQPSVQTAISPDMAERLSSLGGIVTDAAVPEGHVGLHGFLYGSGGAEVHDGGAKTYVGRPGEDDGSIMLAFEDWADPREGQRPAGVFAIYDGDESLQYVGYSRNIVVSLRQFRMRMGVEKTGMVRVKVLTDKAMLTRAKLEEERDRWMGELTGGNLLPPGNAEEKGVWEGTDGSGNGSALIAMTEEERAAYEETKLKLRKAMGDNLYDDVEGEDEDSRQRRLNLLRAVEGDDWSGVIDRQTRETQAGPAPSAPTSTAASEKPAEAGQIVSPFARPGAPNIGSAGSAVAPQVPLELTAENVDKVLDEVRPYLIADGGNVEVVTVENGVVALRLQGACGTCPSSTATMKMGIERSLESKFGERLKQVIQVDKQDIGATVESVNSHLDILRPAITNYGGEVEVMAVNTQKRSCDIRFKGPAPIGMGIQAAIKDKFPDILVVNLLEG